MKILELKLKKDVLIVEIPRLADYEFINRECKYLIVGKEEIKLNASTLDKFEVLCKGSELTEEIASELCHNIGNSLTIIGNAYLDDVNDLYFWEYATDAFITSVECKDFYWLKNPYKKDAKKWQESEEKTFRNPLIFVKK